MSGPPLEIHLENDAKPRACHTPAHVPIHWQKQVEADLIRDVRLGVLECVPFGEPVGWCHRMVVTRKQDGSPRRTVDLSPLNKYCKRETCATDTPFKLARRIPKGTFKTVTDAWNGYHGVPLGESDKHRLSLRLAGSDILEPLKALYHLVMVTIDDLQLFYLILKGEMC